MGIVIENLTESRGAFKTIVKGAGFAFIGMFLGRIFSYFFNFIIARLGTEQYGLLSLGFAILVILTTFSILGLRSGVLRYIAYYQSKGDNQGIKGTIISSMSLACTFSVFIGIALYFSSDFISSFFDPNLSPILKIFSFLIPILVTSEFFLRTMVAFKKNQYSVFIQDFLEKLIKLLLTVLLIYLGYGLYGATAAYVISIVFTLILSFYFMEKKVFSILNKTIKSINLKKKLFFFSLPLLMSGTMSLIVSWTDVLMIGYFKTTSDVGIYNATLTISSLLLVLPMSLIALFLPVITTLYSQGKINEFKQTYFRTSKWIFLLNLPLSMIIFLFSKEILGLFGKDYVLGYVALSILSLGYFVHTISLTSLRTIEMSQKTGKIFWIYFIAALLNVIVNYLLIPKHGILGGAIATSLSYLASGILIFFVCRKVMMVQPFKWSYLKLLIGISFNIMLVWYIKHLFVINLRNIISTVFLFVILYVIIVGISKELDNEDYLFIKIIFKKLGLKK